MEKRRKRGEKYPEGYIESKIAIFVFDYPDGIEEVDIREWLKENYGIGEKKGVTNHLEKLEKKGFLIKDYQKGIANIWKPNPDLEIFKKIAEELLVKDIAASFIQTKYTQKMLKEYGFPLVEHAFNVDLSKNTEAIEVLKHILLKYPATLLYLLLHPKEALTYETVLGDYNKFMWAAPDLYQIFLPPFQELLKNVDNEIILANYFLKMHDIMGLAMFHQTSSPSIVDIEKLREVNTKSLAIALTPEVLGKLGYKIIDIAKMKGYVDTKISKKKKGEG